MLPGKSSLVRLCLILAITSSAIPSLSHANEPAWLKVAYKVPQTPSIKNLAHKQYALFQFFLENALSGTGRDDFLLVANKVSNDITWRNGKGGNIYNDAFQRSYPFVRAYDLQGMPDTIMLLAYMESQWHGKKGKKSADYGYWQLVPEVIREIQTLDYVPATLKNTSIDTIRSDATMSTQAAQIHLHRYHFYFNNVARFPEADAWLLTFTAFNWGAGNVKRMIADMESRGLEATYANFFHTLYKAHKTNPTDKSLKAAVEYVPKLWNIAQLIDKSN